MYRFLKRTCSPSRSSHSLAAKNPIGSFKAGEYFCSYPRCRIRRHILCRYILVVDHVRKNIVDRHLKSKVLYYIYNSFEILFVYHCAILTYWVFVKYFCTITMILLNFSTISILDSINFSLNILFNFSICWHDSMRKLTSFHTKKLSIFRYMLLRNK